MTAIQVWQNENDSAVFGSIPAGNFLLWFGLGLIVPVAERLTRAQAGSGIRRSLEVQALPAAGLGLLQLAGTFLNLAVSFIPGVLFFSLSFSILAAGLIYAFRPDGIFKAAPAFPPVWEALNQVGEAGMLQVENKLGELGPLSILGHPPGWKR